MADTIHNHASEFNAAYQAGLQQLAQAPRTASPNQFVLLPHGFTVADLSAIAEKRPPARLNHKPTFATVDSFCDYFNEFKDDDSRIFADPTTRKFLAIMDYSSPDLPQHCEHRASFTIALSSDFAKWKAKHGVRMDQEEFALFIEDSAPAFVHPDAATMREIATELHVENQVKFETGFRTQDGQVRFKYVEDLQGRAGKSGEIDIPPKFDISIPIFYGGKLESLAAWFRYRLTGGKLTLWYELYRPDEAVDAAFTAAVEDIKKITNTNVWLGSFA